MKRSDASGTSLRSERSLVSSAVCFLGVLLGATACMQPPTQITVNANSSADKTNTNTENYSALIESKESSSTVTAPPAPPRAENPPPAPRIVQTNCYVNDANDTYANLRQSPNGSLVGPVNNGTSVLINGSQIDSQGREWALVRTQRNQTGYIFRALVACR